MLRAAAAGATLALLVAGCPKSPLNSAKLRRALPMPSHDAHGDDWEHRSNGVRLASGTVRSHKAVAAAGVFDLALSKDGDDEPTAVLRYRLPGRTRIPVEVGTEVTIEVKRSAKGHPGDASLLVRTGRQILAASRTGAEAEPALPLRPLSLEQGRQTIYREAGRYGGFCDAVLDHRAAVLRRPSPGGRDRWLTMHPGETRRVKVRDRYYDVTLVDNGRMESSTCPDLDLSVFSYVLLATDAIDAPAFGGAHGPTK